MTTLHMPSLRVCNIANEFLKLTSDERREFFELVTEPAKLPDANAIERAIKLCDGNLKNAAVMLDCSRRTLQNRMRRCGLPPGKPGRRRA